MLTFLLGTDHIANRDRILRLAAEDVSRGEGNRVLLVPELISHEMERRLCAIAGDTASRFAEVLTFTRLTKRVCDEVGCVTPQCLDDGGRIVAVAAAARHLHGRIKAFAAVETKPEFLRQFLDAIDEFKRCCISPKDLMAASQSAEGSLAQKLEELALLYEAYDALCARGKRDPRDQMTWLLEQLEDSDYAENHVFYIDGFPDFTRQHMQILEHLIRNGKDVTISLNCDEPDSRHPAFEKAGETGAELLHIARKYGIAYTVETVTPEDVPLREIYMPIFYGDPVPHPADILAGIMDSVSQECLAAAERVLELVRGGVRYRDIGIVSADPGQHESQLSMLFHRCGIPLYRSGTEDVLNKSAIYTVLCGLDAALSGMDQKDVLRYLKSPVSPLTLEQCDRLENYAILWGIRGNAWSQTWKWNPAGLGEDLTDAGEREREELEKLRLEAITPLSRLKKGFDEAVNMRQQVLALYGFLEDIRLAEHLDAQAKKLLESSRPEEAQVLSQLWEILIGALEQMYDILGETVWDKENFCRLLRILLSQYDVGTIPPALDTVTFGSVSAMRCHCCDHMIVLGASEGKLPGYSGAAGLLSDQERTALRKMGVPLTGGAIDGVKSEFGEIYGVFCCARKSLRVFCSGGEPSYLFHRFQTMCGGASAEKPSLGAVLADRKEAGAFFARLGAGRTANALGLNEEYDDAAKRCAYEFGSLRPESVRRIYGEKLHLSASQTDTLAKCKMGYFLKYGLRAKERKEATVDPAQFGTYVHAVLENAVRDIMGRGGFQAVSLEETQAIVKGYSDAYIQSVFSQVESRRVLRVLESNHRELEMIVRELWEELSQSEFSPAGVELQFGGNGENCLPGIPINGKTMEAEMTGFVDRMDVWEHNGKKHFRVVDYKTGEKTFDYCDVYNGIGLQMLIYLFALEDGGGDILGDDPKPAGVMYFPARAKLITAQTALSQEKIADTRQSQWVRSGLLLDEPRVLHAMDPEDPPKRLKCRVDKEGNLSGSIASASQFRMLKKFLFARLREMVDTVSGGNVTADPYYRGQDNACAYCPYHSVCHAEYVEGRRIFEAVDAERFWKDVEKEAQNHG